jgi:hypothetical protein
MYFSMKSYLKSTRNHTAKHALMLVFQQPLGSLILAVWFGTEYQTCWHVVSSRAHLTNEKKKQLEIQC